MLDLNCNFKARMTKMLNSVTLEVHTTNWNRDYKPLPVPLKTHDLHVQKLALLWNRLHQPLSCLFTANKLKIHTPKYYFKKLTYCNAFSLAFQDYVHFCRCTFSPSAGRKWICHFMIWNVCSNHDRFLRVMCLRLV